MLKVAVRLPSLSGGAGEYLADVSALEAAGTDTIWLEAGGLDAWIVLGALAAVTKRTRLGCMLTSGDMTPAGQLAAGVDAAQKLSRGRFVLAAPRAHLATAKQAGTKIFSLGDPHGAPVDGVIHKLESPGDLPSRTGTHIEVWADIEMPADRDSWSAAMNAYEAAGASGVIVPWGARVIDLLRNPEPDDRTDLLISTG
jgi:hypothetical protein